MFRFSKLAAVLFVVPMLAFANPALAASEGQIEGGNIYRVKNVTKNVDFTDPANADADNVLQYKVRIHDPGPGALTDVRVKVDLPNGSATSNVSTVTVSAINASPSSTTDTATVNLSSAQTVSYQSGTTQLLDANNNVISTLPDGITQGGVSIGNVGVSIDNKRFVQFQAKVGHSAPITFTATATATATANASANASANCPKGSTTSSATATATASATATATATATSTVSQADADQRANAEAKSKAQSEAQAKADAQAKASANAAASAKCAPEAVTTTVTTKTPPALPNTGAGSVIGIFTGVSAVAGIGHYLWRRWAA